MALYDIKKCEYFYFFKKLLYIVDVPVVSATKKHPPVGQEGGCVSNGYKIFRLIRIPFAAYAFLNACRIYPVAIHR